jgi:hypothetical protein
MDRIILARLYVLRMNAAPDQEEDADIGSPDPQGNDSHFIDC